MWVAGAWATNTYIDVTMPNGIVASNNPANAPMGVHEYCVNQQPLAAMVHVQESTSGGAGVNGQIQLAFTGPMSPIFGPQNTDNAGVTNIAINGLVVGDYSLKAQFLGTTTHSQTAATGSVKIKNCSASPSANCCNRPQQELQRCVDSSMKSIVSSCGGDSLTAGMISAAGGQYAEVMIDTDQPYNTYEIYWLANGEPSNKSVKIGYALTDCAGNTNDLIRDINTLSEINTKPPVSFVQLVNAAGYSDIGNGNFIVYSMGPYSYDQTYKTDPTKCSVPQTLNTTTSPNHAVVGDVATSTQLANLASTSPQVNFGEMVQFIGFNACPPVAQSQSPATPPPPEQTPPPEQQTGGDGCQSVVGTLNGHWGEAAFIADIAEDPSSQLNGTYTLTNVGGDAILGTSDDITHSGTLTGNHTAGSATASVTLTYTYNGVAKTTSGTLNIVSDNEINGNTVDFENAPGTHMQAVRTCQSGGGGLDPVTFQGDPDACRANGFVYCDAISDCSPAGYQCGSAP